MGIEKLIPVAASLAVAAAASGLLPKVIQEIRIAQYKLLKESQSSKWGKPLLIKSRNP